jgi:hypothetical protein
MTVSAQADTWPKATQRRIHSLGAQRLHRVNAYFQSNWKTHPRLD